MIRVLTAIVLLSILAGALWLPPIAFVVVLALFLALAWSEYAGRSAPRTPVAVAIIVVVRARLSVKRRSSRPGPQPKRSPPAGVARQ